MESLGEFDASGANCLALFQERFPKLNTKVVLGINESYQQTNDKLCTFYMLKNLQKAAQYPNFVKDLLDNFLVEKATGKNGFTTFIYRDPPAFMSIAKSWDNLQTYLKENKLDAQKICKDKMGREQTLLQYALRERNKHGIVTPKKIANRNYKTTEWVCDADGRLKEVEIPKDKREPEFVYENNSIEYFRHKYCSHTVPTLLNSFSSPEERAERTARIFQYRDARNLAIDPETGEIDNKDVIAARGKKAVETDAFVSAFAFI